MPLLPVVQLPPLVMANLLIPVATDHGLARLLLVDEVIIHPLSEVTAMIAIRVLLQLNLEIVILRTARMGQVAAGTDQEGLQALVVQVDPHGSPPQQDLILATVEARHHMTTKALVVQIPISAQQVPEVQQVTLAMLLVVLQNPLVIDMVDLPVGG